MIYKDDEYVLSTGKTFYANHGLLSLGPESGEYGFDRLHEGYDGKVETNYHDEGPTFTRQERAEIAAFAISLWEKWRDRA